MPTRTGAAHVVTTTRKYKDQVYRTHLLRRSYREGGQVKNETLGNLSHLPEPLIDIIRRSLPYVRRLIDQVGVPDVDSIDGLPPAVALQQQRGTPNARSSVGSVTTLSSFVRILYSRAGSYPAGQPMLYAEDFSPNTPQG